MSKFNRLRVGYVPLKDDLVSAPGDYRRFINYAKIRGISYEIASFEKVYDVVIVTQGADVTLWRNYKHGIIIYDLIDAYLLLPIFNLTAVFRGVAKYITGFHKKLDFSYWKSIKNMCIRADIVICSTNEQRDSILPYCDDVFIVLDYHESVIKKTKKRYQMGKKVKLVWEGMPSNLYQLKIISTTLSRLSRSYDIELNIITSPKYFKFMGRYFEVSTKKEANRIFNKNVVYDWEKDTISNLVCQSDIAIVPIDANYALNKFKPENKILFFWKVGVPVVVSDIPSYNLSMKRAGLNFICKNEDEWYEAIENLIKSQSDRKNAAISGKEYADRVSNTETISKQWDNVFHSIQAKLP